MGAPSNVDPERIRELHIQLKLPKVKKTDDGGANDGGANDGGADKGEGTD